MSEILIGAFLVAVVSVVVTHIYYRLSSNDLHKEVEALRSELAYLKDISSELQAYSEEIFKTADLTKKHVVRGTLDDPEYPYK